MAASLPNTDPVHKVSIIPRGLAALGYTMHRPEGDRYLVTQSELESRIQVLLAGTVAEEIIFGDIRPAPSDMERATNIARSMVMDFGMSRLGRVAYRESRHTMFFEGQEGLHGNRGTASRPPAKSTRKSAASLRNRWIGCGTCWKPGGRRLRDRRLPDRAGDDRQRRFEADHRGELAQPDDCSRDRRGVASQACRRGRRCGRREFARARPRGRGGMNS